MLFFEFWRSKDQKYYKIEHTGLFLFTFFVSFFMAFLAQKLIYAINKSFWARSFIKLNYFRSLGEIMTKMCTYFRTEADVAQNLIDDFFF